MSNFLTVWKREVTACFYSPVAYVTMVIFLAVSGATFMTEILRSEGEGESLSIILFASVIIWVTVLITVIAMRLFAEENRSGTLETLMTAPVTEVEVVLGKYAGAMSFLVVVLAPAVGNAYLLARMSPGLESVDSGAVFGGAAVLILVSGLCMAIGLLVSLMTSNQIVAAIGTFCAIWVVLLFGWMASSLSLLPDRIIEYVGTMTQIEDSARGSVDSRPVVLYVSTTAFMLFVAVKRLESRRWK